MPDNSKISIDARLQKTSVDWEKFVNKSQRQFKRSVDQHTKFAKQASAAQKSFIGMTEKGMKHMQGMEKHFERSLKASEKLHKSIAATHATMKKQAAESRKWEQGGDGGGGRGGGGSQSLARKLGMRAFTGPMLAASLLGALISGVTAHASESIKTFEATGKVKRQVAGIMSKRDMNNFLSEIAVANFGAYGPVESINMMPGAMRATGDARAVGVAQRMGMFTNMAPEELFPFMGAVTQATGNQEFSMGGKNARAMKEILAAGQLSGLKASRMPEFIQGMHQLLKRQSAIGAGEVNVGANARALAMLGSIGAAGQGARGASILNQMDQAFIGASRGGGNPFNRAFLLQSAGFGKPGGQASYGEAVERLEKGVSGGMVERVLAETIRQYGAGQTGALAMQQSLGIGYGQSRKLLEMAAGGGISDTAVQKKINEIVKENQDPQKEMLEIMKHQAKMEEVKLKDGEKVWKEAAKIQETMQKFMSEFIGFAKEFLRVIGVLIDSVSNLGEIVKNGIQAFKDFWNIGTDNNIKSPGEFKEAFSKYLKGAGDMTLDEQKAAITLLAKQGREGLQQANMAHADVFSDPRNPPSEQVTRAADTAVAQWRDVVQEVQKAQERIAEKEAEEKARVQKESTDLYKNLTSENKSEADEALERILARLDTLFGDGVGLGADAVNTINATNGAAQSSVVSVDQTGRK